MTELFKQDYETFNKPEIFFISKKPALIITALKNHNRIKNF